MNLYRGDALFDARLVRPMRGAFDVVVTNPPYLSARNLSASRVARMKRHYPAGALDLYACFLQRCLDFTRDGGRAGVLSMQSFMFTSAYEPLRELLMNRSAVERMAHFGGGLFDVGNRGTLQTVAAVFRRESIEQERDAQAIEALDLTDCRDSTEMQSEAARRLTSGQRIHRISQRELATLPRRTWAYWATEPQRRAFATLPRLGDVAPLRQGLATTDNARFVRYWWEVETPNDSPRDGSQQKWFPYVKSGEFRRWHASPMHVVNWQHDGREIKQSIIERYPYLNGEWKWVAKNSQWYGRAGITYSYLTSGQFSARLLPAGAIFDVAGSAIFPDEPLTLLGVLNSSVASELLRLINPTVNFQVGDLAELPVPRVGDDGISCRVARAVECRRLLDGFDELRREYLAPPRWDDDAAVSIQGNLSQIEQDINLAVADSYRVEAGTALQREILPMPRIELARRWVSDAVGQWFARWGGDGADEMLELSHRRSAQQLMDLLAARVGQAAMPQVDETLQGIRRFLLNEFMLWHARLYRGRPVYWDLSYRRSRIIAPHWSMPLKARWSGAMHVSGLSGTCLDDGVLINLSAIRRFVKCRPLRRKLDDIHIDMTKGKYDWSETVKRRSRLRNKLRGDSQPIAEPQAAVLAG